MSTRVKAYPNSALLEWARKKAGLTCDELARRLKVAPGRIAEWERGEKNPTVKQLRRLGRIVRRPLAFFYLPEAPIDFDAIKDYRKIAGQELGQESFELLQAIRVAHEKRSIAIELLEDMNDSFDTQLPTASLEDETESLAQRIRDQLGCSSQVTDQWSSFYDAFHFWRDSIEARNVLVLQFGEVNREEARGFSLAEHPFPVISVNRTEYPQARIFSLLHEFVHLALHMGGLCDFVEDRTRSPKEQRVEVFCNRVAGAILVPLLELLDDPVIKNHERNEAIEELGIIAAARRFKVSREVILRRMLIADLITTEFYESKRQEYARQFGVERAKRRGFAPPHILAVSASGISFTQIVLSSYRQRKITVGDVSDFLNIRLKHLSRIQDYVTGYLLR